MNQQQRDYLDRRLREIVQTKKNEAVRRHSYGQFISEEEKYRQIQSGEAKLRPKKDLGFTLRSDAPDALPPVHVRHCDISVRTDLPRDRDRRLYLDDLFIFKGVQQPGIDREKATEVCTRIDDEAQRAMDNIMLGSDQEAKAWLDHFQSMDV